MRAWRSEIEQRTGLPIPQAVYRYVVFLPSKQSREIPVPNRFFCVPEEGEVKVRGLECRKHEICPPPWRACSVKRWLSWRRRTISRAMAVSSKKPAQCWHDTWHGWKQEASTCRNSSSTGA